MSGRCPLALAGLVIVLCNLPSPVRGSAVVERLLAADRTTVVDLIPKSGPGIDAVAIAEDSKESAGASAVAAFQWVLQSQNGAVYTDLSMASATRGFASAELRSEEHTSELQSQSNLVCRLLLEKKKK